LGFFCTFQVCVEVIFTVSPLPVVRLQVEARIVPAGRITDVVVFREFVLLLPLLVGPAVAQLGDGEVLLPVMSPVELARGWLSISSGARFLADAHAVDQRDKQCHEPKHKDDNADIPDDWGVCELENDDESDANENESKIG